MAASHLKPNTAAGSRQSSALRLDSQDWSRVEVELDGDGVAVLPELLTPADCSSVAALYDDRRADMFRSRIVMARHGFGRGEYKYFEYPLPGRLADLRAGLYGRLVGTANRWHASLGLEPLYPPSHDEYLRRCHAAGQLRATPLLLRYGPGDYNCLHQDLYGTMAFPLQVVVLLSAPGVGFDGGELVLTEQRPRMQSRPMVVPLRQGDAAVFAVNQRPVRGSRGMYRVTMRHGVSRIRSGTRSTLGLIFHDAA